MSLKIEPCVFSDAGQSFLENSRRFKLETCDKSVLQTKGTRTRVTGAHQMDGFTARIKDFMFAAGISSAEIYSELRPKRSPVFLDPKEWEF